MTLYLGTSGWQYRDWRSRFYPEKLPQRLWLEHYAQRFATVELNNSFYMLPRAETFAGWAERSPEGFVFAVKMSRYLTHIKRLREPQEPMTRFFDNALRLGDKLGPVLLQLPPNLKADPDALDETLRLLPAGVRATVEFRHPSWYTPQTRGILERHDAALCLADRGSKVLTPLWRTADWTYLRFHEGAAQPHPCYGRSALESWADRIDDGWSGCDVYVYFNNDPKACAVRDARLFALAAARRGLEPTRIPGAQEVLAG